MRPLLLIMPLLFNLNSTAQPPDDTAIRQLIQHYVDVRNHMDEKVLRTLFTPDADQLVSTGQWRRGLEDLVQGAIASSKKEDGHSSVTVVSLRMLGNDNAIADGRYVTSARTMWSTFVLQRTESGWRIAAIRNMLPAS